MVRGKEVAGDQSIDLDTLFSGLLLAVVPTAKTKAKKTRIMLLKRMQFKSKSKAGKGVKSGKVKAKTSAANNMKKAKTGGATGAGKEIERQSLPQVVTVVIRVPHSSSNDGGGAKGDNKNGGENDVNNKSEQRPVVEESAVPNADSPGTSTGPMLPAAAESSTESGVESQPTGTPGQDEVFTLVIRQGQNAYEMKCENGVDATFSEVRLVWKLLRFSRSGRISVKLICLCA